MLYKSNFQVGLISNILMVLQGQYQGVSWTELLFGGFRREFTFIFIQFFEIIYFLLMSSMCPWASKGIQSPQHSLMLNLSDWFLYPQLGESSAFLCYQGFYYDPEPSPHTGNLGKSPYFKIN